MSYSWRSFFISGAKKFFLNLLTVKKILWKFWHKIFPPAASLMGAEQNDLDQKLFAQVVEHRHKWPSFSQLKYVGEVLSSGEKKKIKIYSLIAGIALVAFLINGYFALTAMMPANGGAYSEGAIGYPKYLNPLYASFNTVDTDMSKLIYSGLVGLDNQNNLVPDLAEKWEISPDQKTYTFYLRPNVTWHNGEKLTVADVLFTYNLIKDVNYQSPWQSIFAPVKVEAAGDQAIRFILPTPLSSFLENFTVGIMPQSIWQDVNPSNMLLADYNLKPVGSGPFMFKSLSKDKLGNLKSYTLTRYKDFYQHPAYLEEITFKFYPDYNSAIDALKNHNIDGLNYLSKDSWDQLSSRKDLIYHNLQLPQYTAIFFNTAKNADLADLKVRQALACAIDKKQLIEEALKGAGSVIDAPILAGFIGFNPNINKYDYQIEKAKQLLTEAGWVEKDGAAFRFKKDKELKITLTTINRGENPLVVAAIQKMWQAVGVKTEINLVDAGAIKTDIIKPRVFEALVFGEIMGFDPDPFAFWHSSQAGAAGLNLANFINKEADKLLEEARQSADPQARHNKYVAFQNILSQQLPAIFLYAPKYIYPVAEHIKGIDTEMIVTPADRFTNVINWYINTKRAFK